MTCAESVQELVERIPRGELQSNGTSHCRKSGSEEARDNVFLIFFGVRRNDQLMLKSTHEL